MLTEWKARFRSSVFISISDNCVLDCGPVITLPALSPLILVTGSVGRAKPSSTATCPLSCRLVSIISSCIFYTYMYDNMSHCYHNRWCECHLQQGLMPCHRAISHLYVTSTEFKGFFLNLFITFVLGQKWHQHSSLQWLTFDILFGLTVYLLGHQTCNSNMVLNSWAQILKQCKIFLNSS